MKPPKSNNRSFPRLSVGIVVAISACSFSIRASADTLTFNAGPFGALNPGIPISEGIFTYDVKSGQLFNEAGDGNPSPDMEGSSSANGGVMRVVRNDVAGGLFTFVQSDIRFEFGASHAITFTGLKGGVSQGVDVFFTTANSTWTTIFSSSLAGKALDELDVNLDANSASAADVDNVALTAVPEPGSLLLLGVALGGPALLRQRGRD